MGGVNDNGDFEFLDQADQSSTARWQGNVETRRGDVVLTCAFHRAGYLHSIWRALDDGFADPFFYFYNSMQIGRCAKLPPICFQGTDGRPGAGFEQVCQSTFFKGLAESPSHSKITSCCWRY